MSAVNKKKEKVKEIVKRLKNEYPDSKCSLIYDNPFQLLVATILSAQCTDERVNKVTEKLFAKYPNSKSFASLSEKQIGKLIYSTGFYNNRVTSVVESISAVAPILLKNASGFPAGNQNFTSLITFTINNIANYITGVQQTVNVSSLHTVWNMFEVQSNQLSSIEFGMTGIGEIQATSQFAVYGYKNA